MVDKTMTGYDGEGTIPRGSAGEKLSRYLNRVYGHRSFLRSFGQGALVTVLNCFPTMAGCWLRGRIYRMFLGSTGSDCYLEKNLRFYRAVRLFLGDRVFLGESSFFDVGRGEAAIRIGDDSHVSRGVTMRTQAGEITVGRQVNIGSSSFIYSFGGVDIGDYCLIANGVELISGSHNSDRLDIPIRSQGRTASRIVIGPDVWLGTRCVVLGGVKIGRGAIIGAGAVVTRDIPEYAVAVGMPARVIRTRSQNQ